MTPNFCLTGHVIQCYSDQWQCPQTTMTYGRHIKGVQSLQFEQLVYENTNCIFFIKNLELGKTLLKRNISLIYGAGSLGLMGVLAKTVHEGGGKVEGILPKFFLGLLIELSAVMPCYFVTTADYLQFYNAFFPR